MKVYDDEKKWDLNSEDDIMEFLNLESGPMLDGESSDILFLSEKFQYGMSNGKGKYVFWKMPANPGPTMLCDVWEGYEEVSMPILVKEIAKDDILTVYISSHALDHRILKLDCFKHDKNICIPSALYHDLRKVHELTFRLGPEPQVDLPFEVFVELTLESGLDHYMARPAFRKKYIEMMKAEDMA